MSRLERGMVDPDRSVVWNFIHYRSSDETQVWSSAHQDTYVRMRTLGAFLAILAPIALLGLAAAADWVYHHVSVSW